MASGGGAIEIEAHAPAWLSLLLFARWRKLSIEIDGALGRVRWGTHTFAVAAGEHVVRVGLGADAVKASIVLHVVPDETVRLRYTPRWIRHIAGSLEVVRVPTAHVVPR